MTVVPFWLGFLVGFVVAIMLIAILAHRFSDAGEELSEDDIKRLKVIDEALELLVKTKNLEFKKESKEDDDGK